MDNREFAQLRAQPTTLAIIERAKRLRVVLGDHESLDHLLALVVYVTRIEDAQRANYGPGAQRGK